jgi:hypothetical protein
MRGCTLVMCLLRDGVGVAHVQGLVASSRRPGHSMQDPPLGPCQVTHHPHTTPPLQPLPLPFPPHSTLSFHPHTTSHPFPPCPLPFPPHNTLLCHPHNTSLPLSPSHFPSSTCSSLSAEVESLRAALSSTAAQAERWRRSATQLQEKYKAVDLEEYGLVREEAGAAKARVAELEVGGGGGRAGWGGMQMYGRGTGMSLQALQWCRSAWGEGVHVRW